MDIRSYIAVTLVLGMLGMIVGIVIPMYLIPAALLWSGAIIAGAIVAQKTA